MSVAPADFGRIMPAKITLADVAVMAEVDEHHRYELTSEGVLVVMTPPSPAHQRVIMLLIEWLLQHGYSAKQIFTEVGIFTGGGRQPDLTVWATTDLPVAIEATYADTANLLLAVEIVSPSSKVEDKVHKREEYARAGIPRYWLVEQGQPQTVLMLTLNDRTGEYESRLPAPQPLRWLLTTDPHDYLS